MFWRDVSYSPKLTTLWKNVVICVILDKNQLDLMRLIHAMRSNGPLPKSVVTDAPCQIVDKTKKKEVKIKTASIQSGFFAAEGSVSMKSG